MLLRLSCVIQLVLVSWTLAPLSKVRLGGSPGRPDNDAEFWLEFESPNP